MEYIREYAKFLEQFLDISSKVRVLFDLSNGSTGLVLKELLKNQDNIEAIFVNDEPDGNFPGHGPNPLDKKATDFVKQEVIKNKVDMGVVFDGDGDRVFFFDNLGESLDSYEAFSYIKNFFKGPYVVDVRALPKFTIQEESLIETKVGRYFVVKAMKEHDAELGVEYSGHFYFKNFFYTDSGILASIYMLNHLSKVKSEGRTLSDVEPNADFVRLPEASFAISSPQEAISKMQEHFSGEENTQLETLDGLTLYTKNFAFNIRGSATEPVVRFVLVAKDNGTLQKVLKRTKEVLGIND